MNREVREFCLHSYKATQSTLSLLKYILVESFAKGIISYYKRKAY